MKCKVVIIDKEKNIQVNGVACKTKKDAISVLSRIVDNIDLNIYTAKIMKDSK